MNFCSLLHSFTPSFFFFPLLHSFPSHLNLSSLSLLTPSPPFFPSPLLVVQSFLPSSLSFTSFLPLLHSLFPLLHLLPSPPSSVLRGSFATEHTESRPSCQWHGSVEGHGENAFHNFGISGFKKTIYLNQTTKEKKTN